MLFIDFMSQYLQIIIMHDGPLHLMTTPTYWLDTQHFYPSGIKIKGGDAILLRNLHFFVETLRNLSFFSSNPSDVLKDQSADNSHDPSETLFWHPQENLINMGADIKWQASNLGKIKARPLLPWIRPVTDRTCTPIHTPQANVTLREELSIFIKSM